MGKVDVKARLNTIVYFELKELRDTMDYFSCHRVEFDDEDTAPRLNLKVKDGHYANWIVRVVTWDDDDNVHFNCHLLGSPYRPDEGDSDCDTWFDYEDDDFRGHLVPGEITELTKRIESEVEGISNAYAFNSEQEYAIIKFNEAATMLDKAGVSIILDNEDGQTYFINANAIEDIAETDEDGRKELVLDSMKKTAHVIDFQFFGSDGVFAKPKTKE